MLPQPNVGILFLFVVPPVSLLQAPFTLPVMTPLNAQHGSTKPWHDSRHVRAMLLCLFDVGFLCFA